MNIKKSYQRNKKPLIILIIGLFILTALSEAKAKVIFVKGPAVRLREEPSTLSNVVKILGKDEKLEIIGQDSFWYEVTTERGTTGWLAKRLVTEKLPLAEKLKLEKKKSQALQEKITYLQDKISLVSKHKNEMNKQTILENEQILKLKKENKQLLGEINHLKSTKDIILALIGAVIFIIGWLFGFLTGFYKKQSDNKRMENMLRRTKSSLSK